MTSKHDSWNEAAWNTMLRGLTDGDPQAFMSFWERYGDRLNRVASSRLPRHLQRRVEPEDVVQSVCRTFFRRMHEGCFDLRQHQQIWPLLCAITLNKVRMQIRFQLQEKRHPGREVRLGPEGDSTNHGSTPLEISEEGMDPQEAAAFAEQLERVLNSLDEEQRQIIQLRLEGYSGEEIADRLEISTRTVRRISSRIREQLAQELLIDLNESDST